MFAHGSHVSALLAASYWRHARLRSLGFRCLRSCLPAALLLVINRLVNVTQKLEDVAFLAQLGFKPEMAEGIARNVKQQGVEKYLLTAVDSVFVVAILVVVLFAFILFMQHIIREKASNVRALLHSMGLSRFAYWLVTLGAEGALQIWAEVLLMLAVGRLVTGVRFATEISAAVLCIASGALIFAVMVWGALLSFVFGSSRLSVLLAMLHSAFVGSVAVACSVSALWYEVELLKLDSTVRVMTWCPIIPSFHALILLIKDCHNDRCPTLEAVFASSEIRGLYMLVLREVAGYLVLLFVLDIRALPSLKRRSGTPKHDGTLLEVQDLMHTYGWLPGAQRVLDGVSFNLRPGTILALLGPNGAGKTTTIKCVTGDEQPRSGNVALRPPAHAYASRGRLDVGLCPQDSIVVDDLTVEEHFALFARIKGTSSADTPEVVERFLDIAQLHDKRRAFPAELSGGMKRRLAIGSALIGNSAMTMLDEPTTGLDPISRRAAWRAISAAGSEDRCFLLTTHMLEEAEELCSDVVILCKGRVASQGSVQELKDKHGTGYLLSVDVRAGDEARARAYLEEALPEGHGQPSKASQTGKLSYQVGRDARVVGRLFTTLAEGAAENGIRHWGISQASLEDAYVQIVTGQS